MANTMTAIILALLCGFLSAASYMSTICDTAHCTCNSFSRVVCSCIHTEDLIIQIQGKNIMLQSATEIIVHDCPQVTFESNVLQNLHSLHTIHLLNIKRLVLNVRSMSRNINDVREHSGVQINITNAIIPVLPSNGIQGRVTSLTMTNCTFQYIAPFAFSSLVGLERIQISNSIVEHVEIQAFKKFSTERFAIINTIFQGIPSRMLTDIDIMREFVLDGVVAQSVASSAFVFGEVRAITMENCDLGTVEGEMFRGIMRGSVTIHNNIINTLHEGALMGLTAARDLTNIHGPQDILFSSNNITTMDESSLAFNRSSFRMKIQRLNINRQCDCDLVNIWTPYIENNNAEILCVTGSDTLNSISLYKERYCIYELQIWWILLSVLIAVAILIALIVGVVIHMRNNRRRNLRLILPAPRTYQEVEMRMVVERSILATDM